MTFARLFSGSPFKPLSDHREAILESLMLLNRQLQSVYIAQQPWQGRPDWLMELPRKLEKLEQDVLLRLQKPSLTALPKDLVITIMQTQCNLAHLVCRLAERLSYRPLDLPGEQQRLMHRLCNNFGKAVYQLRHGAAELDALSKAGFRKQHSQSMYHVRQQLALYTDELRQDGSDLRSLVCHQENAMSAMDVALLFMTLDDIGDLTLWMRSLIVHLQPSN